MIVLSGAERHEFLEPTVPSEGAGHDPIIDAGLDLFDLFQSARQGHR